VKQCLYRFEVRTGHGENVRGLINQRSGQRLAAQSAYICAFLCADFYGRTGLAAGREPHARPADATSMSFGCQSSGEKAFRDRAPTNVSCADEEDVFHGSERAANAFYQTRSNLSKSISVV